MWTGAGQHTLDVSSWRTGCLKEGWSRPSCEMYRQISVIVQHRQTNWGRNLATVMIYAAIVPTAVPYSYFST